VATTDSTEAGNDELAIFIDSEGNYRILIPDAWGAKQMPEFAALAVAAVLRLARKDEIEFSKGLAFWAKKALDATTARKPKPSKH
jgi:hypothetical protein